MRIQGRPNADSERLAIVLASRAITRRSARSVFVAETGSR
jgi:hypothetical protein